MTPASALSIAKQFHLAHELCDGNGLTTLGGKASPDVPSVVNLLFAIELALKASLLAHGIAKRTHELNELFALLPESEQSFIAHHACIEPISFKQNLDSVVGSFKEWRYAYEQTGVLSISLYFLQSAWLGVLTLAEQKRSAQVQALRSKEK